METFSCNQLATFLENFNRIRNAGAQPEVEQPKDIQRLARFFKNFAEKLHNFRQSGALLNIFEICGPGRDELRNCSVLAWLLDENGSHGLESRFLEEMLKHCAGQRIISPAALAAGYATRTEFCPNADKADRVDIVCDGNRFLLYIEVKIDSSEHSGQTQRYFAKLENNAGEREKALVFISPDTPPECPDAKFIRWAECANILEKLSVEKMNAGAAYLGAILKQYAGFVRKF